MFDVLFSLFFLIKFIPESDCNFGCVSFLSTYPYMTHIPDYTPYSKNMGANLLFFYMRIKWPSKPCF